MTIEQFYRGFKDKGDACALVYRGHHFSYAWLYQRVGELSQLVQKQLLAGSVVQLVADFSPNAVAMLFALALNKAIISPVTNPADEKRQTYEQLVAANFVVSFDEQDNLSLVKTQHHSTNDLIATLRSTGEAGLLILSSGSSGKPKVIVHNLSKLFSQLDNKNKPLNTIAFLLFDHIGGLNTLWRTLINGGTIIMSESRTPKAICQVVAEHRVQALVTSPSFLNLLLLSQLHEQYDLSSLKVINYGSEPMPEFLLKKLVMLLPHIRFSQAYGMSELGVINMRSKSSDSLLIKLSDASAKIRVKDGMLEVLSHSSMLGYLNAPSPFTDDGWLKTDDHVEVDGDYIRILGRRSEIINVGGEKVYPAEIEDVLMAMDEVADAVVVAEQNAMLGNIVKAKIKVMDGYEFKLVKQRVRQHCRQTLPLYKVPQRIEPLLGRVHSARFKKIRQHIKES